MLSLKWNRFVNFALFVTIFVFIIFSLNIMEAFYKIKANELDSTWIESIKKLFSDKDIIIKISTEMDETDFLMMYPANEKHLLENLAAEPAVKFSGDEFKEYVNKQTK